MENLDLTKILKDVSRGTKLYSTTLGYVRFKEVDESLAFPIKVTKGRYTYSFTEDGYTALVNRRDEFAEPSLYPAHDQRDWSKFKVPTPKVKVTLHPFDNVLVRCINSDEWIAELFSHYDPCNTMYPYVCVGSAYSQIIPYNKDTAHLLGTHKKCPIDYEIEFSKEFKE